MLLSYIQALVGDANDAEDILQEVGVQVLKKDQEQFPEESGKFAAWCRGIARNLVLHHYRARQRNRVLTNQRLLDLLDLAYEEADPKQESLREYSMALGECLRQLPHHSRDIIRMRYFDGLTSPEIAKRLQRTPVAIRKALSRLRDRLEYCIRQRLAVGGLDNG